MISSALTSFFGVGRVWVVVGMYHVLFFPGTQGGLFLCLLILLVVGLLLIISMSISLSFYGVIEFVSSSLI